eukprot:gnl/Dysnectes_brevis/5941_a8848_300.p1 GENE.gnl/Dysnectes_brevis/5941_a8848_300~~gnl/Dysnectes_brevis/5941_a8848_300.p1  ORF type:complete len:601 (+),score=113.51 gnl/Dysnectes_brevis/5941_a8848_300:34-1836(+)
MIKNNNLHHVKSFAQNWTLAQNKLRDAIKSMPTEKKIVSCLRSDVPLLNQLIGGPSAMKSLNCILLTIKNLPKDLRARNSKEYSIVILGRSKPEPFTQICEAFLQLLTHAPERSAKLMIYPRAPQAAIRLIEKYGLVSQLIWDQLHFTWIPVLPDLLSLEQPELQRAYQGDPGNYRLLRAVADMGAPSHIVSLGRGAVKLGKMCWEHRDPSKSSSGIARLVLVDRRVDPVTPLLAGCTYLGALADRLGMRAGLAHIPEGALAPGSASSMLDASGSYAMELAAHTPAAVASEVLREDAIALTKSREKLQERISSDPKYIYQANLELRRAQPIEASLTRHLSIWSGLVRPLFEGGAGETTWRSRKQMELNLLAGNTVDLSSEEDPIHRLRLLCLGSITKPEGWEAWLAAEEKALLRSHGAIAPKLAALERSGYYKPQGRRFDYRSASEGYRLFNPSVDPSRVVSGTAHFTTFGYSPLIPRWAEVRLLGLKPLKLRLQRPKDLRSSVPSEEWGDSSVKGLTLVVMIGGCTAAEVSAFSVVAGRAKEAGSTDRLMLATSEFITSTSFMDAFGDGRVMQSLAPCSQDAMVKIMGKCLRMLDRRIQ